MVINKFPNREVYEKIKAKGSLGADDVNVLEDYPGPELPDSTAADAGKLLQVGADGNAAWGDKLVSGGKLYKVLQAHTSQSTWVPGAAGTESLYARIDEEHDGTKYDPIPYEGNMALENGKYYTQSGVLYKCTRDTGNPVYHALSEPVGLYVEVVSDGD